LTAKGLLRIGQIGAGPQAHLHLQAFVESAPVGDVYLVAPEGPEREALVRRWGIIKRVVADEQELLADETVDVLNVALAPEAAPAVAEAGLRAGKHVILEAPPAVTLEAFDGMVAAAEAASRRLFVQLPELMHPALIRGRRLVQDGEIGAPCLGRCLIVRSSAGADCGSRFAALYQAAYVVQYFLGPARTALAEGAEPEGASAQLAAAVLTHEGPALGEIAVSCTAGASHTQEMHLVGPEGLLLARDDPEDELPLLLTRGRETMPVPAPTPLHVRPWLASRMLGGFIECLVRGTEPETTLAEARAALATTLAMEASAQSGVRVVISP
jgi:predicted dehydrogenase